jgi:ABC-type sugar transport system ATPase subunit
MARIEVQGLHKIYGKHVAVQGLDLEIAAGELLVLLGPSGCGKTTTLNLIAGLDAPSSGAIMFDGQDVTGISAYRRNVAMVFQSALLYPHLTALRNIETSLRHRGLDRAARRHRIAEVARMLGIEILLNKLPSELSGGERQLVATAKAIVREPEAFLLDEPLSALDAALRLSLRAELVKLQKRLGVTTVFVTHDQVEAMTMGDRIAVMSNGRLEQVGTPDEIYNAPVTLFVAGFIGTPPMNLIAGEIVAGQFRQGRFSIPVTAPPGPATLGVRPQDVRVVAPGGEGALQVEVFAMEHLGRESVLIAESGDGSKIRVLVPANFRARMGDHLGLLPDSAQCLVFGADGRRVIVERGSASRYANR